MADPSQAPTLPAAAWLFSDVDEVWDVLPDPHHDVIASVRAILERLGLPFVQPQDTSTSYDAEGVAINLHIRHACDGTLMAVCINPQRVTLHWPPGSLAVPELDQSMAEALESLLTGHNVIHGMRRAGTTTGAVTEVWLPGRLRRVLPRHDAPGLRAAALRRLPWRDSLTHATLSFARDTALAPAERRDIV